MKRNKAITLKQTSSAAIAVQRELHTLGLWNVDSKLANVEIYFYPWSVIYEGFFYIEPTKFYSFFGFEPGHIYIPKYLLIQLFWQTRCSLRDLIRHEYGHALAYHYEDLIEHSMEFKDVFGGHYYAAETSGMKAEAYISEYAKTMPMEDFAETFMVYVRRKGILPANIKNVRLKKKWMFIKKTIKIITTNENR